MSLAQQVEEKLRAFGGRGIAWRNKRVTVVVPDATRPIDHRAVLGPLLTFFADHGARAKMLVALGLHRRMRADERAPLAALAIRFGVELVEHDVASAVELEPVLGPVSASNTEEADLIPRAFAREVLDTDLIFAAGVVEPHQYAGFSGGAKAVAIGCAGRATIGFMHGLRYLRDPAMRLGEVDKNPFARALAVLVRDLPELFALQLVPSAAGDHLFLGPWEEAFAQARRYAAATMFEPVGAHLDWALLPVPAVKAKSFYQASRAATYVALVDRPAIRSGGTLVLEAPCPEGIGGGEGERACAAAMMRGRDQLLRELRGEVTAPDTASGGAQRAYVLARALSEYSIVLAGAPKMPELEAMGIRQINSVDQLSLEGSGKIFHDVFLKVPRHR